MVNTNLFIIFTKTNTMRKSLLFLLILTTQLLSAQIITDLGIYPPPAPLALPAAGGSFTDPTFGTDILRVTDETDGTENEHGYSYWQCFNADNSIVYVYSVNGIKTLYDLDTAALTISNKRSAFPTLIDGESPLGEDQIWDAENKNIIYCHTYKNIVAYNVSDNTFSIIKNLDGFIPNNEYIYQMSMSDDATKFAFSRKRLTDYNVSGYLVYDVTTDSVYSVTETHIDEVQLNKAGTYLWVKTDKQGEGVIQSQIINLTTWEKEELTDNGPDFAPGHGDVGLDFIIGADNWENRLLYRKFDNPHTFYSVWNFEGDWGQDVHVSQLATNEQWILISCYMASTGYPFSGLIENEILQVSTDGLMSVRRLCHHQSDYIGSGSNYWASPRASISRDGRFVIFDSNWGNPDRTDVFIMKIPAAPGEVVPVSISDPASSDVKIFPNPGTDHIQIQTTAKNSIHILNTYNYLGANIDLEFNNNNAQITDLPSGIYFTQIIYQGMVSTLCWEKK